MKKSSVYELVLAAMFTAIGVILPMIFHAFGLGREFLPMHIPVLLCGLICGYRMGGICGAVTPFLSAMITGMPSLVPIGITMIVELCIYGIVAGLLVKRTNHIVALIVAMIVGRLFNIFATLAMVGLGYGTFSIQVALAGLVVTALPGIVVQLIFIPIIMIALKTAKLIPLSKEISNA